MVGFSSVMLFGMDQLAAAEPAFARRLGVIYLAEAAIFLLVAQRFGRDRRWLLIPILLTAVEDANFSFQYIGPAVGVTVPNVPDVWFPLAGIAAFVPIYLAGYFVLGRQAPRATMDHDA